MNKKRLEQLAQIAGLAQIIQNDPAARLELEQERLQLERERAAREDEFRRATLAANANAIAARNRSDAQSGLAELLASIGMVEDAMRAYDPAFAADWRNKQVQSRVPGLERQISAIYQGDPKKRKSNLDMLFADVEMSNDPYLKEALKNGVDWNRLNASVVAPTTFTDVPSVEGGSNVNNWARTNVQPTVNELLRAFGESPLTALNALNRGTEFLLGALGIEHDYGDARQITPKLLSKLEDLGFIVNHWLSKDSANTEPPEFSTSEITDAQRKAILELVQNLPPTL
jgi:hypothetical protein